MIRLALLLVLLALPVQAETAKVRSGEHAGFSRLVVTLDRPGAWTFGRVADGYELRIDRPDIHFDLAEVFSRIPKTRIGAVSAVAAQSALSVTASCACHAEPFEFRPGIIVIDLKDGPPPGGSRFEIALDPPAAPVAPLPRPAPSVAPAPVVNTGPLQDLLLRELGQAAAAGAIELAIDPKHGVPPAAADTGQIRILPEPGFATRSGADTPPTDLGPDRCLPDDRLALRDWLPGDTVALLLGPARTDLAGEFDDLAPDRVRGLLQLYLAAGFGAEARQLVPALPKDDAMAAVYRSLSYIVDGEPDPVQAFAGMENCDSAAALWAVLSRNALRPSEKINTAAVVRSFSALPAGLRDGLNDALGRRLLEQGDAEAARKIKATVLRTGPQGEESGKMLAARLDSHAGDVDAARGALDQVIARHDPQEPRALIERVRLAAETGETLPPAMVTDLETVMRVSGNGAEAADLAAALVLARALSGDFPGAFSALSDAKSAEAALWRLLAAQGPDSILLERAVLGDTAVYPDTSAETARRLATRLLDLGFADAAGRWLARAVPDTATAAVADRNLAARIALARKDGRTAINLLAGEDNPEAQRIKAQAALQLGDSALAANLFATLGDSKAEDAAQRLARDWARVKQESDPLWAEAATRSAPLQAPGGPPLAASRSLLDESAATRKVLAGLLETAGADR